MDGWSVKRLTGESRRWRQPRRSGVHSSQILKRTRAKASVFYTPSFIRRITVSETTYQIPDFEAPVSLPINCPLRIGIIGAGSVANGAHLPQYRKAGYQVVGCADLKAENAEATKERWNLAFSYTDY